MFCVNRDLPVKKETYILSLLTIIMFGVAVVPQSMQSAFHDFHQHETMKYHLHYPTWERDNNLPNRNHFLKVCVEIQFIFFNTDDRNTPHLHFRFFFHPLCFRSSLSHSGWLTFFLPFLHFLMHTYNRAALKGCESLPKSCVGGPFLSELHSQAAFNINHFLSSDVSARYLGCCRLWRSALAIAKNVKYEQRAFLRLYVLIWKCHMHVCFRRSMWNYSLGYRCIPCLMLHLRAAWKFLIRLQKVKIII